MEFPIFQFVPVASLILSLGSTEKHLAPSSLFYEILLSLFFSRLCNHSSFTLSSCQLWRSLNELSLDLLGCTHVLRSPGQDSTAGVSLVLSWGETSPPWTCWHSSAWCSPGCCWLSLPGWHCRLLFNLLPVRTWFLLCLEIISRVVWYTCRMKEKVWNNTRGDNMALETSV